MKTITYFNKITRKFLSVFSIIIICSNLLSGQNPDPKYSLVRAENYVQSKNYYLLTLFGKLPEVSKLIATDGELAKVGIAKKEYLSLSLRNCGNDIGCFMGKIRFSDAEIMNIGNRLVALYDSRKELKSLVQNHLIPSGCYVMSGNLSPSELLRKAWEQDAKAVNFALEVYGERSRKPNYPSIDSISFNVLSKDFPIVIYDCSNLVFEDVRKDDLFFMPTMDYALRLIEINDRNRAADYEPMETTCNKKAYDRIKIIHWTGFKYSMILVPGEGPEIRDEPLSPIGMLRCRVAAYRWKEGYAPFIMVSGGKVHPYKTKYCEAEEMKRYLMETMHVPENAIFMEPHARHTTTNMRNCARLIFRYGIPFEKPCITSTTREQSYYITDKEMQDRCVEELGYSPYKNGRRLSETEAEFYPLVSALQIDMDEPMDP
jgi:hypothetical protein